MRNYCFTYSRRPERKAVLSAANFFFHGHPFAGASIQTSYVADKRNFNAKATPESTGDTAATQTRSEPERRPGEHNDFVT